MSYTAEQLRAKARNLRELGRQLAADDCEAHAAALEENARLTKRADDAHGAIKTLTQIVFEWKGRAERAEAELAKLRQHAEAMAGWVRAFANNVDTRKLLAEYDAYRADFQGE